MFGPGFGMGASGFWVLLLIVGPAVLVWGLVEARRRPSAGNDGWERQRPEDILRERLARGEISEEDYRQRLRVLRGG